MSIYWPCISKNMFVSDLRSFSIEDTAHKMPIIYKYLHTDLLVRDIEKWKRFTVNVHEWDTAPRSDV